MLSCLTRFPLYMAQISKLLNTIGWSSCSWSNTTCLVASNICCSCEAAICSSVISHGSDFAAILEKKDCTCCGLRYSSLWKSFKPSIFLADLMSRATVLGSCFCPVAWRRFHFFSRYLRWVSLNRVAFLVVFKAEPSGKVSILSGVSSSRPSTAEIATLVPSTKQAWYFVFAKSKRVYLSGILLHCPNDRCFSRLEWRWYILTHPSFGQVRSSPEDLSGNVGCSPPICTAFFELSCETETKSPGESFFKTAIFQVIWNSKVQIHYCQGYWWYTDTT